MRRHEIQQGKGVWESEEMDAGNTRDRVLTTDAPGVSLMIGPKAPQSKRAAEKCESFVLHALMACCGTM